MAVVRCEAVALRKRGFGLVALLSLSSYSCHFHLLVHHHILLFFFLLLLLFLLVLLLLLLLLLFLSLSDRYYCYPLVASSPIIMPLLDPSFPLTNSFLHYIHTHSFSFSLSPSHSPSPVQNFSQRRFLNFRFWVFTEKRCGVGAMDFIQGIKAYLAML